MMKTIRSATIAVCLTLGLGMVLLAGMLAPAQADAFSSREKAEIEATVRAYLLENPEVILDALRILETRRQEADTAARQSALRDNRDQIFNDSRDPVVGNASGQVTVVEFFDYQCGYCKQSLDDLVALLEQEDDVRLVLKEFPILGPGSLVAAKAALAALRQDAYWEMHQALMQHRGRLSESEVLTIAREIGLNAGKLRRDMDDPEIERTLNDNIALARRLNIGGTPAFIIGDHLIPGAINLASMQDLVAKARGGS